MPALFVTFAMLLLRAGLPLRRHVAHLAWACLLCFAGAARSADSGLLQQAEAWLQTRAGLPAGTPQILAPDTRVRIPECPGGFSFSLPFQAAGNMLASCADSGWSLYLQVRYVVPPATTPSFSRNLQAGHRLGDGDVVGDSPGSTGRFLRSNVRAGQAVTPALLDEAVTVLRLTGPVAAGQEISAAMVERSAAPASRHPAARRLDSSSLGSIRAARALTAGHILTLQDVQRRYRMLTASKPIARGELVDATNTETGYGWGTPASDLIDRVEALPRAMATTQLSPGQPIRRSTLRPLPAIAKGETVNVSVSRNLVTVTVPMTAQTDGETGKQITLRNEESGELIRAIVTGPGSANIP